MAPRPNILVLMTDQQQAQVVDPEHPCITPNADRLSREGTRFSAMHTPTAHCCPARASFMTGQYPSRHGVWNNVSTPSAQNTAPTSGCTHFAELLRSAGYRTAFSGKWHVSAESDPDDHGWDVISNIPAPASASMQPPIDAWRDHAEPQGDRPFGVVRRPGWGDIRLFHDIEPEGAPRGWEESWDGQAIFGADRALRTFAGDAGPWLMFVGLVGPHDPFRVPRGYTDRYDRDAIGLPPNFTDRLEDKPRIYQRLRRQLWDQLGEDEVRASLQYYWAYCTLVDEMLGVLLDTLDDTGQADNTCVVFLSDHGELCGAHGLYLKGVPAFREAYEVPGIVRWPGVVEPGGCVDALCSLADWAPTFCEVAGIPLAAPTPGDGEGRSPTGDVWDGRSLLPLLRGGSVTEIPGGWRDDIYAQMNGTELYYSQRMVRTERWKYVFNGFDVDELYDLQADPHETVNRIDDGSCREELHGMVRRLWRNAARTCDEHIFSPYGMTGLAPWGPGDTLGIARGAEQ